MSECVSDRLSYMYFGMMRQSESEMSGECR